ncbi:hypothetical protein, partial [Pantoea stewartii]|uniref:hypothetical protein n=1 Tax=Pantoea stewartii TaxID=66269 RepID=UPI001C268082
LQNGNDLVFGESGFTHGDLLRGHNQYVGRSLKVNGSFYRDAYMAFSSSSDFRRLTPGTSIPPYFLRQVMGWTISSPCA